VDSDGEYDTRSKVAFLIEDEDAMAARNRGRMVDATQFHPSRMEGAHAVTVALFNYMIANSDWSPVFFHNSVLLRTEDGRYLTVPYDFDWSGAVNARYATPDPSLDIRNVRQRVYRGFCRPELAHGSAVGAFRDTRDQVRALYQGFATRGYEQFDADDAKDALEYLDDFYRVVDEPREFERGIVQRCRSMETG
jgi:hypothetical protein